VPGDTNNAYDVFVRDRQSGTTSRVSLASNGAQGSANSTDPAISADGRFVAFVSNASNLVAGDTNDTGDIFVHDRQTGTTSRVSVASGGTQGSGPSSAPSISADGRFVAFGSDAANLVAGDTNGEPDVFVHDRQTGTTSRVSVASDGTQGITIFHSDVSFTSSISADGRFIAFDSDHGNLVAGDRNQTSDVFVRDQGPQEVITFLGFERPVEDLPFTNSAKAGRTIPIKWQLTDETGAYIRDPAIVKSLQFANVACDSQDTDYEHPIDAPAAGASKLRYDRTDEHFIYNWKTPASLRNTCAVFVLTLANNDQHFARFMLK
jgi:tricorn protease-like protein